MNQELVIFNDYRYFMLSDVQINALNELLSTLNYISCYRVGSCVVPFIKNIHDEDVSICFTDDELNILKRDRKYIEKIREFRETYNIDIHFQTIIIMTNYIHWDGNYVEYFKGENLDNQIILPLDNIEETKEELIKSCNRLTTIRREIKDAESLKYKIKLWYHIYTLLCYINNDSYDLTEEQIENINILHDREEKDLEKRTKLIDDMIKEIESW